MLIGLTGLKGSGKDTVADMLVEHYDFTKVGFADLLKDSVCNLFGITREQIEKWKNDSDVEVGIYSVGSSTSHVIMNFRNFLQRYGTEAHRDVFGVDFWVTEWSKWKFTPGTDIVVPDVRFDNEAMMIEYYDGFVYKIERPQEGTQDLHASEAGVNPLLITGYIYNGGTIQDLYNEVEEALAL